LVLQNLEQQSLVVDNQDFFLTSLMSTNSSSLTLSFVT